MQCTVSCLCGDYPVCRLSEHGSKLLMTYDKDGK